MNDFHHCPACERATNRLQWKVRLALILFLGIPATLTFWNEDRELAVWMLVLSFVFLLVPLDIRKRCIEHDWKDE